ncbi:MAG: hypothetical protein HKP09_05145, partial [Enterobacterales bacterium]|nr:hypothetical protein [Enterobacterales bacterium]
MFIQFTKAITIVFMLAALSQSALAAKPKVDEQTWQQYNEIKGQQSELDTKERLLKLKTALKLRDDQMTAWGDYEQHMLQSSEMRHSVRGAMRERRMQRKAPPTSVE